MNRADLPDHGETDLYLDSGIRYGAWRRWADAYGYKMTITEDEPDGECIALVVTETVGYLLRTHAVVWNGGIVWDPERRSNRTNDDNVHMWIKLEKTGE